MFAVIVTGQLVQTNVVQVEETKFLFNIEEIGNANHIVVFMTGQTPFPDGYGSAVFLNLPTQTAQVNWQLLGHLTNEKPSAIFKISSLKKDAVGLSSVHGSMNVMPSPEQPHHAQVGISIDLLSQLAQQTPATGTTASQFSVLAEFPQKMLQTFYNYSSSFAASREAIVSQSMSPNFGKISASDQFVPLATLDKWYQEFQAKLSRDPNFWKS